ncbi:MAG: DMT family transporter [Rhodospirillaceae bacterium]|jgi:drug/metabolite transporter (DMT)-like permease|nr:DMT family transporter [Rhodospirillaceae bacterium]MBT5458721.1 DMT family transporter [Rhodospirillaceae bacterium]
MTPIERPQNVRLGIMLMMAGLLLFTAGEAIVKTLARDYDIAQIVWARYVFHALITFAIFSRVNPIRQARTPRPGLHLTRSALMLVATTLFFTSLRYLPLADAVAINFIAPLLVTALSIPMLKEQVGIRRWSAIFVGFAGVLVIIRPGMGVMHWAAILPLITAVCYAFYQILTRIATRTDDTQTSLFWTSLFGVVVTSVLVPFFWITPSAIEWVMMVALGGVYGLGHYLLIRGLEVAPASMLSPFLYTQIIWATLFGLVIFDQFPDGMTLLGVAIVIGSGLYIWRRETAQKS